VVAAEVLGDWEAFGNTNSFFSFEDWEASRDGLGLERLVVGSKQSLSELCLHEVSHQVHELG